MMLTGIIGLLEKNQIHNSSLIVNRIRMDMVRRGDMMSIDDVTEILSIPLIGAIQMMSRLLLPRIRVNRSSAWIPWPEKPIQIYASVFSALKYLS